ncbi:MULTISPECIES: hypothetical protein [Achromobacter]|uniref:Uncharacterized protein n=1 Tax=Achromobacter xylosoxidans (strain A8) TaxID=762376 RepID=E3HY90_ACHXA|nr:hypothetical protein [Achromobacter xylosoxidans]ADP20044.1 hypothetical protein AXYL_06761 [Achromobacter xylosoxidans A8]
MCQCYCRCNCDNDREKAKRYAIVAGIYVLVFALSGAAMFSSLVENGYAEWASNPLRAQASPVHPPEATGAPSSDRRSEELTAAVAAGDVAALNELKGLLPGGDRIVIRLFSDEQLKRLVAKALTMPGTANNAELLNLAGQVVIAGEAVPYANQDAVQLLSKAWTGGKADAARDLTLHLKMKGDPASAYLWALRCVRPCMPMFPASEYRKQIDSTLAARIEELSKDSSIVFAPRI